MQAMFFVLVKPEQKVEQYDLHKVSCVNNMKTFSLSFNFYQSFDIQSFKGDGYHCNSICYSIRT